MLALHRKPAPKNKRYEYNFLCNNNQWAGRVPCFELSTLWLWKMLERKNDSRARRMPGRNTRHAIGSAVKCSAEMPRYKISWFPNKLPTSSNNVQKIHFEFTELVQCCKIVLLKEFSKKILSSFIWKNKYAVFKKYWALFTTLDLMSLHL